MPNCSGRGSFTVCEATWGWTRPDDDVSILKDAAFSLDRKVVFPLNSESWALVSPSATSLQAIVPNCAFFNATLTKTGADPHILEVSVKPTRGYLAVAFLIWW
jgi:hypothetical protein